METIQGVQKGRQFQQYSNGFGGSDLQTAASGHGGHGSGCCDTGVDFATLLALIAGMPHEDYLISI